MFSRKGSLGLALCAALASAGMVRGNTADEQIVPDQLSLSHPAYLDDAAPPPPPKPLMGLLEQVGVGKSLEAANINLYGFVEGGYSITTNPARGSRFIPGNVFNTKQNRVVLDQADFTVERTVDAAAAAKDGKFDIGARFEVLYGWDAGAVHSSGLFDNPSVAGVTNGYYRSRTSPENQFDINQAYLDLALPIGNGVRVRLGKFVTLLGQEVINPTGNALYSHSYLFGFAIPFTQTGALVTYVLNDKFTIDAGITRGWNQTLRDNNGDPDFLGRVTYTVDKATSILLSLSEGPQTTRDNHDWWTVVDLIVTHTVSDNLTIAFNADYGDAPNQIGSKAAQWYGAALYAGLTLDPHFTVNVRGEAYDDNNGFTLGAPTGLRVYEATLGVACTPFPDNAIAKNFVIRPEVRYDYSDHRFFGGGARHDQLQFAVDAIFSF